MNSLQRYKRGRLSLIVGASLSLTVGAVWADEAKTNAAQSSNGIMNFANVRVVNAPAATAPAQNANAEGLRAYLNPTTGKTRAQSQEEGNKIADQTNAREAAKAQRAARAGVASVRDEEARTIYGTGGVVGVELTEEHLNYEVAHKTDDGLVREEVTGKSAAKQALHSQGQKSSKQEETSHAR